MNEKLIGRFYFKITKNGNLIGEFSNNLSPKNFTESADLIKQDVKGFEGNYYSSWLDDTDVKSANLFIRIKKGCKDIYTVNWKAKDIDFFGEGFICDDIFIGDYRNFDPIP